ncbi:MAG: hypothetical protein AAFV95_23170 [Bacteroidota bacterium]
MEQPMEQKEIERVEASFASFKANGHIWFYAIIAVILFGPIIPTRRHREPPANSEEYIWQMFCVAMFLIPTYLITRRNFSKSLRLDLKEKTKTVEEVEIRKKERSRMNDTYHIQGETTESLMKVGKELYEKIERGDVILIWRSKHAEVLLKHQLRKKGKEAVDIHLDA